jgi:hypothetical protein
MAKPATKQKGHDREYHIVPENDGWIVEYDDTVTGLFSYSRQEAITLALPSALRDLHRGLNVIICVQERDGSCRKVWP